MLWCAIVNFNVHVRELQFPVVAATGKDSSIAACGLLVLTTDEVYVLWRPSYDLPENRGRFEHVRQSELLKIVVGARVRIDDASLRSRLQSHCAPVSRA
jgi:hypothetical protein